MPVQAQFEPKIQEIKRFAAAQIRIELSSNHQPALPDPLIPEQNPSLPSTAPVTTQPGNPAPTTAEPAAPSVETIRLAYQYSTIDGNTRRIYREAGEINAENPIRVFNPKEGGYSSYFTDSTGFIRVAIGEIPAPGNSLTVPSQQRINWQNINFTHSATMYSYPEAPNSTGLYQEQVSALDISPRGKARYSIVHEARLVDGFLLEPGMVVVGLQKHGVHEHEAEIADFASFRIYDKNSGNLLRVLTLADIEAAACTHKQCFDIKKFQLPAGSFEHGAKVAQSFSTADLFPGKNFSDANQALINIQKDLEREMAFNINMKNRDWRESVLRDFNQDENTYSAQIFSELNYASLGRLARLDFLQEHFSIEPITADDSQLQRKYEDMSLALGDLLEAKVDKWEYLDNEQQNYRKLDNDIIQRKQGLIEIRREEYENKRTDYNQYLKNGANNSNPAPAQVTRVNQVTAPPRIYIKPNPAVPPASPEPPAAPPPNKKKKKKNKKKKR